MKHALQHRATEREARTWLTDFFGHHQAAARRGAGRPTTTTSAVAAGVVPRPAPAAAVDGATVAGHAVLKAADIRVSFGGVRAVDGVSLDVRDGEILGLVGPNGSGKTTFLNALTGVVPASGYFAVDGPAGAARHAGRSRAVGVLRTYQAPQTYDHLSCIEDVLVSTSDRRYTGHARRRGSCARGDAPRTGPLGDRGRRAHPGRSRRPRRGARGRLTYGQRRLLELARAIAAEPRVLLLDEPSAGLDASETEQLAGYLARPARRRRVAPGHRPQARLHHRPVRPGRGARAGPSGRRRRRRTRCSRTSGWSTPTSASPRRTERR